MGRSVGELDPLNRRLCSEKKPDVVVQIVILAEDNEIRDKLLEYDLHVQTINEVEIKSWACRVENLATWAF
ncbi:unnamed protein product [Leptidea sinapis]|uniref:Phosphorylase b kinase regulatory subunit n=1 Tax=Leptidea sinapis TaxID=189913 RepID=A0A5E4R2A3_9NEOP|nr:unnamed protein product [Leptidea sinapis]